MSLSPANHLPVTEADTLAAKQKARRLAHLTKLPVFAPAWWTGIAEYASFVFLAIFNLWLFLPLFGLSDPNTPFSGPVIPVLAWLLSQAASLPQAYSLGIWWLIFLVSAPITWAVFVREITGRRVAGLMAGLLISLPTGLFAAARTSATFQAKDGAHMAGLALVPLALLAWIKFCRHGGAKPLFLSSLAICLVALTSPFALLALSIFLIFTAFSEMLLGHARLKATRLVTAILLAAGFSSFWYNPKFLWLIIQSPTGKEVITTFWQLVPISLFATPLLATVGFLLFERRKALQPVFLSLFFSLAFLLIRTFGTFPGHPDRYLAELGLSLAFLFGVTFQWGIDWLRSPQFASFLNRTLPVLSPIGGEKLAWPFALLVASLIAFIALTYRSNLLQVTQIPVLGLVDPAQQTSIWQLKAQSQGLWSYIGSGTTALTFLTSLSTFTFNRKSEKPPLPKM